MRGEDEENGGGEVAARCFVALPIPPETARVLALRGAESLGAMKGARLSVAADLHLTLRFLGDLAPARVEAVRAALGAVQMKPFALELTGVGAFRSVGVIYAAVGFSAGLLELFEEVTSALARRGIPRELRPFTPHVTLARVRRAMPGTELERWSAAWEPLCFDAEGVALYRRARRVGVEEKDGGARYERMQTFPAGEFWPESS